MDKYFCAPSCRNYALAKQRIYSTYRFTYTNCFSAICKWLAIYWGTNSNRSSNFFQYLTVIFFQKFIDEFVIVFPFKISCTYMCKAIAQGKYQKYPVIEGNAFK